MAILGNVGAERSADSNDKIFASPSKMGLEECAPAPNKSKTHLSIPLSSGLMGQVATFLSTPDAAALDAATEAL
jgi:hypothetical protein